MEKNYFIHHVLILFVLGITLIMHYFILYMEETTLEGSSLFFILLMLSNYGVNIFKEDKNLVTNKLYYHIYNLALLCLLFFMGHGLFNYIFLGHTSYVLRNFIASGTIYLILILVFLSLDIIACFLKKRLMTVKYDISNYLFIATFLICGVNIYYKFQILDFYTNFPWIASIIGTLLSAKMLAKKQYLFEHKDNRRFEFFLVVCLLVLQEYLFAFLVCVHLLSIKKAAS